MLRRLDRRIEALEAAVFEIADELRGIPDPPTEMPSRGHDGDCPASALVMLLEQAGLIEQMFPFGELRLRNDAGDGGLLDRLEDAAQVANEALERASA